ncbi:MAG: undecaprenyl-diphosphate phosphatase [bacterium]|jgi:undecaprenyl-diphosphatase
MTIIQALILGLVQGLTEFLPVSSSGHLVLLQALFGISEGSLTFDILVHFGTLLAVLAVFHQDILAIVKQPFSRLPRLLLVGSAVTAVFYFLLKDYIEALFTTGRLLGVSFLITGIVLSTADRALKGRKNLTGITYPDAAFVGLMQGLAILPAVSRSGITITGALLRGIDRETAARFSFLLSLPVILGASLLELPELLAVENAAAWPVFLSGMAAAAIAGYFAIRFMLKVVTQGRLRIFAYYVFGLGILVLADQFFFRLFFPPLF